MTGLRSHPTVLRLDPRRLHAAAFLCHFLRPYQRSRPPPYKVSCGSVTDGYVATTLQCLSEAHATEQMRCSAARVACPGRGAAWSSEKKVAAQLRAGGVAPTKRGHVAAGAAQLRPTQQLPLCSCRQSGCLPARQGTTLSRRCPSPAELEAGSAARRGGALTRRRAQSAGASSRAPGCSCPRTGRPGPGSRRR